MLSANSGLHTHTCAGALAHTHTQRRWGNQQEVWPDLPSEVPIGKAVGEG